MKYAKQLHKALLPYFHAYRKAKEYYAEVSKPTYHLQGENLDAVDRKYREACRERDIKKAEQEMKIAKEQLQVAIVSISTNMREKFEHEITGDFAFNPADVDEKVVALLNSNTCRPFDLITMYRTATNMTNKRLIAAKLNEYTQQNRKEMTPIDIEGSVAILSEVNSHNPETQLKAFNMVSDSYIMFARGSNDTICKALPAWAESVGLGMEE